MAKIKFTDPIIRALPPSDGANRIDYALDDVRGFAVQTTKVGAKRFLLVYVARNSGQERRMVLGEFGPAPRLSVSAARRLAAEKRALVDLGRDPWLEHKEQRAAAEAKLAESNASFGDMLAAYVASLHRAKKVSADGVQCEIKATIATPFKGLWKKPAVDVTLDDLVTVLNRLTRTERWRQAEKTRSYIRAAYTAAAAARGSANASDLLSPFSNVPNIARDLATIERPKLHDHEAVVGKRALSPLELAAYWQRIRDMKGPPGALLRAHLLTGAQRCAQLARLTRRSISSDALTLLDGKGRRKKARAHVVPLLPEAGAAFAVMSGGSGDFIFTLDGGKSGAGFHAVRRKVAEVAQAMLAANEVEEAFTPGELRITVETRLAAAGVSMEVRAQLQSHGLGGVQNKHYDKHDYLGEKRTALLKLRDLLDHDCNVVDFQKHRTASN